LDTSPVTSLSVSIYKAGKALAAPPPHTKKKLNEDADLMKQAIRNRFIAWTMGSDEKKK
jgi:hypothetical protein